MQALIKIIENPTLEIMESTIGNMSEDSNIKVDQQSHDFLS